MPLKILHEEAQLSTRRILHTGLFLALLMMVLAACGAAADPTSTVPAPTDTTAPAALEGSDWLLTSLDGRAPLPDTNITLKFQEGQATGHAGCNSYGGAYGVEGGRLTIAQVAMTLMMCVEPPGVMEQEMAYLEALQGEGLAYQLAGDRLQITNPTNGRTLLFNRKPEFPADPAALVGTRWRLVSMDGQAPLGTEPTTLVFDSATEVSGFAGCRNYRATYQAGGDDILFPMMEMLEVDCTKGPDLLEQEGRYTDLLGRATNYRPIEGRLEILTAPGAVLVFEEMGP